MKRCTYFGFGPYKSPTVIIISGCIGPIVATALTAENPTDITGWRTLFLITMGLYIFTWFLYVSFVKVKPLPFDDQREEQLNKQEYKEI